MPALLGALALVAWLPSIPGSGFSFDDREVVFGNPVIEGTLPWSTAFDRDYWHHIGDAGHYRPIATLSLRLDHALYGEQAPGYRITNALLHALVVLLAAGFWKRAFRATESPLPWFGILVFACHPLLADAVAWISGRTSMLSALGGLIGVHLSLHALKPATGIQARVTWSFAGAFLATALAMLAKEDGFVFGGLVLWLLAGQRKTLLASALGTAAALGFVLYLRHLALGSALPTAPYAPLAEAGLFERLRIGGLALLEGVRLAVFPVHYPPQFTSDSLMESVTNLGARSTLAVLAWLFVLIGLTLPLARFFSSAAPNESPRTGPVSLGSFFALLACLPLMQILPAGEIFAPRWAYLPLLFAAPGLSVLTAPLRGRWDAAPLLLVLALVPLAWKRAQVYESRASFRHAVLETRPEDAPSWNDLGIAFWEEGREAEAVAAWKKSARLDPRYSRPLTNLGNVALQNGELDVALKHYRAATERGSNQPLCHLNFSNALRRKGEHRAAARAAAHAIALAPGMGAAHRASARALFELRDLEKARDAIGRALELDPADPLAQKLERSIQREMLTSPP